MSKLIPVDTSTCALDIQRDLSIKSRERMPGPPQRIDGMTIGIVTMNEDAPHGGEVHPDGDELLYVISGHIRVICDSDPGGRLILGPVQGCIVPRGEWHKVSILEKAQFIHITPGPNGDHRALTNGQKV